MSFRDIKQAILPALVATILLGPFTVGAFLVRLAIFAGINYLVRKSADKPDGNLGETSSTVRGALVEPRWVLGRARIGGHLVFVEEWGGGSGVRYARWILVLHEGEASGIERVWVNNQEMPLARDVYEVGDTIVPAFNGGHIQRERDLVQSEIDAMSVESNEPIPEVVAERDALDAKLEFDWHQGGNQHRALFACQLCYGGEPPAAGASYTSPISDQMPAHPQSRWSSDHRLYGKTYLVCVTRQFGGSGGWLENGGTRGIQEVQVLLRGVKPETPRVSDTWTENAADLRYHYHTELRGRAPSDIDAVDYNAAHDISDQRITIPEISIGDEGDAKPVHATDVLDAVYGDSSQYPSAAVQTAVVNAWNRRFAGSENAELRYSINRVIPGASLRNDPFSLENGLDLAWAGYVIDTGGRLHFRPGVNRSVSRVFDGNDFLQRPEITLSQPLVNHANSLDLLVTSSARHDWTQYSLERISDEQSVIEDGGEFVGQRVSFDAVAYPNTAYRLGWIMLRQAAGNREMQCSLSPGLSFVNLNVIAGDRVHVDLDDLGNSPSTIWRVQGATVAQDGGMTMQLAEEPNDLFNDEFTFPLGFSAGSQYLSAPPIRYRRVGQVTFTTLPRLMPVLTAYGSQYASRDRDAASGNNALQTTEFRHQDSYPVPLAHDIAETPDDGLLTAERTEYAFRWHDGETVRSRWSWGVALQSGVRRGVNMVMHGRWGFLAGREVRDAITLEFIAPDGWEVVHADPLTDDGGGALRSGGGGTQQRRMNWTFHANAIALPFHTETRSVTFEVRYRQFVSPEDGYTTRTERMSMDLRFFDYSSMPFPRAIIGS